MSVLQCSRTDCESIMCNRYSSEYGYLCEECFNELVALGKDTDIEEFLNSSKETSSDSQKTTYDYFDNIFLAEYY